MIVSRRILFVCLGNTCRSPMAAGYFRHILQQTGRAGEIGIASAGTRPRHIGDPAHPRAIGAARRRGFDISGHRCSVVTARDLDAFDMIVAVDLASRIDVLTLAPLGSAGKLRTFVEFAPAIGTADIPDPWGGSDAHYEHALDLIGVASEGLLASLIHTPGQPAW